VTRPPTKIASFSHIQRFNSMGEIGEWLFVFILGRYFWIESNQYVRFFAMLGIVFIAFDFVDSKSSNSSKSISAPESESTITPTYFSAAPAPTPMKHEPAPQPTPPAPKVPSSQPVLNSSFGYSLFGSSGSISSTASGYPGHNIGVHHSTGSANGSTLYQGPRGGTFYVNSSGNRTYVKRR
jgi:hypothetical protein